MSSAIDSMPTCNPPIPQTDSMSGLSAQYECMSTNDSKRVTPRYRFTMYPNRAQRIEFSSKGYQSTTILPTYLDQLDDTDAVLLLVKARWNEHMVEDVLMGGDDGISDDGYQEMLMKHKLARAQLEVEIYSHAIAKSHAKKT